MEDSSVGDCKNVQPLCFPCGDVAIHQIGLLCKMFWIMQTDREFMARNIDLPQVRGAGN